MSEIEGTAVIVDNRADEAIRFVIEQTHICLPNNWRLIWFHGSRTITEQVVSRLSAAAQARLRLIRLPHVKFTIADYNRLCLSVAFWESIPTENILVFQRDGCPLHLSPHKITDFLEYDYVGAPWCHRNEQDPLAYRVGNGGFSFRKRSAMIKALNSPDHPHEDRPEDLYFSYICRDLLHIAPFEVGCAFSVEEDHGYVIPFGFHKYRHVVTEVTRGTPEIWYLQQTF